MSFLLNPYILAEASGGGDSIPITADLAAHFQADADNTYSDAGITLAVDGNNIRQINDVSGNSNNLDQSTASNQLIFKDDSLQVSNGKYWKGNSVDVMNLTSDIFVDVLIGYTSFMVCKKDTLTRFAIGFGSDPVGSTVVWNNLGEFFIGTAPFGVVSAGVNSTDWAVVTVRITHNGTVNVVEAWVDSTSVGTATGFNFSSNSNLQSAFNRVSPINKNDVEYAELVHYDAPLSDTDVVTVSDWLKTRHSIT